MSNFIPTSFISIDNTGSLVLSAFKTTGGVTAFPGGLTVGGTITLNGNTTFNADLILAQALRLSKATLSANTTLADNQVLEEVNATTGPLTITLPNAGTFTGILYIIKKIDNTANAVTVATSASQTIDGQSTAVLSAQYQSISVISNGTSWDTFGGGSAAGSNTWIQYNNNGSFGADANFTWNGSALTITNSSFGTPRGLVINNLQGTISVGAQGHSTINIAAGSISNAPGLLLTAFGKNSAVVATDSSGNFYIQNSAFFPGNFFSSQYSTLNVSIGDGTGNGVALPDASAALDVQSLSRGFLPPRMTTTQKLAISSPAAGLIVYDTTLGLFQGYFGGAWSNIGSGGAITNYVNYVVGTATGSYTGSLTVFDTPWTFTNDGKSLQVYYDGVQMVPTDDYTETSNTRITFVSSRVSGRKVSLRAVASSTSQSTTVHQRENYVVGTALNSYTGSATVFNLLLSYNTDGKSLQVWNDGVLMTPGVGNDYIETSSSVITFNTARVSGSKMTFSTDKISVSGQLTFDVREDYVVGTASGNYTGSTTAFDLTNSYIVNGKNISVFVDGVLMIIGLSNDYVETSATRITFNSALLTGQTVSFSFKTGTSALNAQSVNGISAQPSTNPQPSQLVALDAGGKIPTAVLPSSLGINYVTANDGSSTIGWATYNDGAVATPVDGTGGTAVTTITSSSVTPLRGSTSLLIVKDTANRQGEGVSYDFTIDPADKARILQINFDYNQTGYIPNDLTVWIYDKTNAVLLPVSPFTLQGVGANNFQYKGIFQTSSSSTSYRLIIHTATTTVIAGNLRFDNIYLGPQSIGYGSPVQDWQTYTPTYVGFGTVSTQAAQYRRVGDSLEVQVAFLAGTVTATTATLSLPAGMAIDNTKIVTPASNTNPSGWGTCSRTSESTTSHWFMVFADGTTTDRLFFAVSGGTSGAGFNKDNGSGVINSNAYVVVRFTVPVSGWSSTVLMSNDTDTRVVAMKATTSSTNIITGTPTTIVNPTVEKDTHGAYNTTTGIYTVPVSGRYRIATLLRYATASWTALNNSDIYIDKNGTHIAFFEHTVEASYTEKMSLSVSTEVDCVVGDTLNCAAVHSRSGGALALEGSPLSNYFTVSRISGPSAIAATESVSAIYGLSINQSIANSVVTNILWDTKEKDSHSAMNTSTGIYTVPTSGTYRLSTAVTWSGNSTGGREIYISKNGTITRRFYSSGTMPAVNTMTNGALSISCLAGDTLAIAVNQASGGALSTVGATPYNYVCIERTGN